MNETHRTQCTVCKKKYIGPIGSTPCCGAGAESRPAPTPEMYENAYFDSMHPDYNFCPDCGADMMKRHHAGDWHAPECWWWECEDDCGFKTNPE